MLPCALLAQDNKLPKSKKAKEEVIIVSGLNKEQELCRIIGSEFAVPTVNYEPVTPPKFWKKGTLTELGFSQVSLSNWAAGGSGSVALNAYLNAHINYAKGYKQNSILKDKKDINKRCF